MAKMIFSAEEMKKFSEKRQQKMIEEQEARIEKLLKWIKTEAKTRIEDDCFRLGKSESVVTLSRGKLMQKYKVYKYSKGYVWADEGACEALEKAIVRLVGDLQDLGYQVSIESAPSEDEACEIELVIKW